jgi:hypothetical protein
MLKITHCLDNRLTDGRDVSWALVSRKFFLSLVLISVVNPRAECGRKD